MERTTSLASNTDESDDERPLAEDAAGPARTSLLDDLPATVQEAIPGLKIGPDRPIPPGFDVRSVLPTLPSGTWACEVTQAKGWDVEIRLVESVTTTSRSETMVARSPTPDSPNKFVRWNASTYRLGDGDPVLLYAPYGKGEKAILSSGSYRQELDSVTHTLAPIGVASIEVAGVEYPLALHFRDSAKLKDDDGSPLPYVVDTWWVPERGQVAKVVQIGSSPRLVDSTLIAIIVAHFGIVQDEQAFLEEVDALLPQDSWSDERGKEHLKDLTGGTMWTVACPKEAFCSPNYEKLSPYLDRFCTGEFSEADAVEVEYFTNTKELVAADLKLLAKLADAMSHEDFKDSELSAFFYGVGGETSWLPASCQGLIQDKTYEPGKKQRRLQKDFVELYEGAIVSTFGRTRVEKSYFHDAPDVSTQRKGYVVTDNVVRIIEESGEFVRVSFSRKGKVTRGWLFKADLER